VTHDQLEAVTMADRMAVMDGGVLQQYDRPERVFENPVNLFVAGFVGSPAMNFLKTRVASNGTGAVLEGADGWRIALSPRNARRALAASSSEVWMGARHSTLRLAPEAAAAAIPGQGVFVSNDGPTFSPVGPNRRPTCCRTQLVLNQPIFLAFDQKLHLFDAATGSGGV
jgi:multiple sugar transport system ATP-binding protein